MLYGSCPEEQPADQIRTGVVGASFSQTATFSAKNVKCAGSRKKAVWFTVLRSMSNCVPQPDGSTRRT